MEHKSGSKKNYLDFIGDFFSEVKKVVWPAPKQTFKNTWITLVMIFIVGLFVWAVDQGLMYLFRSIMDLSK